MALNEAEKTVANTFKVEWQAGFDKVVVKVGEKVVKEVKGK